MANIKLDTLDKSVLSIDELLKKPDQYVKDFLFDLESYFSPYHYMGDINKDTYSFYNPDGERKSFVSAVHTTYHVNLQKDKDTKQVSIKDAEGPEQFTGVLSLLMAKEGFPTIIRNNYNLQEIIKNNSLIPEIVEAIRERPHINGSLDIHGCYYQRNGMKRSSLYLGTNDYEYIHGDKNCVDAIGALYKNYGFEDIETKPEILKAKSFKTLANQIYKMSLDEAKKRNLNENWFYALQLEINELYRNPHKNLVAFKNLLVATKETLTLLEERQQSLTLKK